MSFLVCKENGVWYHLIMVKDNEKDFVIFYFAKYSTLQI